jgi:hypothetical protein
MTKKYIITNDNLSIDYLFYIVIFLLTIYLIIQIITNNSHLQSLTQNENFINNIHTELENLPIIKSTNSEHQILKKNITSLPLPLTIEQQLQEIKSQNNALKISKSMLEENIKKQNRTLFLSENYYKIEDNSFNNQLEFINDDFANVKLPEKNLNGKTIISNNIDWHNLLTKASEYKNSYNVGDVVLKSSDFNISKDDICYKDYSTHLSSDPNFKKKFPECMVCSINPESNYTNTNSWKNTKTNIQKVCLFNPNVSDNSSILNYNGCKKLCNIK